MHEMIRKQPGYGLNIPGICFRRVIATQGHCSAHFVIADTLVMDGILIIRLPCTLRREFSSAGESA